jgi:hypothetical protein
MPSTSFVLEQNGRIAAAPLSMAGFKLAMLQNLSGEVQHCLRHAEDCAQRAKSETDPSLQRDFLEMELRWLKLARSYQFAEQLKAFTSHNNRQREELIKRVGGQKETPTFGDWREEPGDPIALPWPFSVSCAMAASTAAQRLRITKLRCASTLPNLKLYLVLRPRLAR